MLSQIKYLIQIKLIDKALIEFLEHVPKIVKEEVLKKNTHLVTCFTFYYLTLEIWMVFKAFSEALMKEIDEESL